MGQRWGVFIMSQLMLLLFVFTLTKHPIPRTTHARWKRLYGENQWWSRMEVEENQPDVSGMGRRPQRRGWDGACPARSPPPHSRFHLSIKWGEDLGDQNSGIWVIRIIGLGENWQDAYIAQLYIRRHTCILMWNWTLKLICCLAFFYLRPPTLQNQTFTYFFTS